MPKKLIPLHQLAREAHDVLVQQLDKRPLPNYVNYSLTPLRWLRDNGIVDCITHEHIVPGNHASEYTDMFILRLMDRWGGWRGPQARHFKAEFQKHIDHYNAMEKFQRRTKEQK